MKEETEYLRNLVGREIIAFSGNLKYRGELREVWDSGYLLLGRVAVMNYATSETNEFSSCLLNLQGVSALVSDELMGRGTDAG